MQLIKPIFAANLSNIYSPAQSLGGNNMTLSTLLNPLIKNILTISGIAAFVVLILAGFSFISSTGDEKKLEQASNMLNYALIGLLVIAAAWLITKIIGSLLGYDFF